MEWPQGSITNSNSIHAGTTTQKEQLIAAVTYVIGRNKPNLVVTVGGGGDIDWYYDTDTRGIVILDREGIFSFFNEFDDWAVANPEEASRDFVEVCEYELDRDVDKALEAYRTYNT